MAKSEEPIDAEKKEAPEEMDKATEDEKIKTPETDAEDTPTSEETETPPEDVVEDPSDDMETASSEEENKADPEEAEQPAAETEVPEDIALDQPNQPEPQPEPQAVTPQKQSSGFIPLALGGVLTAALGFFAAEADLLGSRADIAELRQTLLTQESQIEALQAVEPPVLPQMPDISGLTERIDDVAGAITAIEDRIAALEARPAIAAPENGDAAAYEAVLQGLQTAVDTQRAEIETLLQNARDVEQATAEAARSARAQAALTQITVALNNGAPFETALSELAANTPDTLPQAFSDVAASGVATVTALQTDFAENARAALDVARASGTQDAGESVGSFLRRQLGARSVTPREGSDPDAVLSRAEAAMRAGDVASALAEIDTLPDDVQAAMSDWLSLARARTAAEAAAQDLSQSLTAN